MTIPRATAAAAILLALLLSGCGGTAGEAGAVGGPGGDEHGEETGEITVAVAASLGAAFASIADEFERDRPGVDVRPLVIDGSSTLTAQLRAGAPYDVLVSADEPTMAGVADLVGEPVAIATSTLVIVVPEGNPGGVGSLEDLARVATVVCAPQVPCGDASARLLAAAGVEVQPVSLEQSVRGVLAKVEANAVDAGLVYATDAAASDAVATIVPAGADAVVNRAVIATVSASSHPALATAFVAHAAGSDGRSVLERFGFGAP